MANNRIGVTVNLYLDGSGYSGGCDIQTTCEVAKEDQYRCPYGLSEIMPMEPGATCSWKNCGICRVPAARIDALKKALAYLKRELKREESAVEDEE